MRKTWRCVSDPLPTMAAPLVCITGPQICDKTSLLFQYALTCAEQDQQVLFISPSQLKRLPLLSKDQDKPNSHVLERIQMRYPATLSDLEELIDGIHETKSPQQDQAAGCHGKRMYSCVIVNDFHKYFVSMLQNKSHEQIAAVARVCAHMIDAVNFLSSKQTAAKCGCSCVISTDDPAPIPGLKIDIVQRWFPTVLKISAIGKDCTYIISRWDGKDQEASYTVHQTHFEWHQKLHIH